MSNWNVPTSTWFRPLYTCTGKSGKSDARMEASKIQKRMNGRHDAYTKTANVANGIQARYCLGTPRSPYLGLGVDSE